MNCKNVVLATLGLSLAAAAPCAQAAPTLVTKLLPKLPSGALAAAPDEFGAALALSDRWLAVGEPSNNEQTSNAGAIHVFDARTGKLARKLFASDPPASRQFGSSLALSGNLLFAGAPADNTLGAGTGAVYVFNLANGKQIAKWTADDAAANSGFGNSLAVSGNLALIGAFSDDGIANNAGAAYVFDIASGQQLHKLTASDAAAGHIFGQSAALKNGVALIGAINADGAVAGTGAAYLFDATTGEEIDKLFAAAGVNNDAFGYGVALDGGLAFVSAPVHDAVFANEGAVFAFDLATGSEIATIRNPVYGGLNHRFGFSLAVSGGVAFVSSVGNGAGFDGNLYRVDLRTGQVTEEILPAQLQDDDVYGYTIAAHGNQLAVGAIGDDTITNNAGAVYLFKPVPATLPFDAQALQKDSAPGTANAKFASLGLPFIARSGSLLFTSSLSGPGASSGKNSGIWNAQGAFGSQVLLMQKKDPLDALGADFTGTRLAKATALSCNHPSYGLFRATVSGPGINGNNNQALLRDNGAAVTGIIRTGGPVLLLGEAHLKKIGDTVQNRTGAGLERAAFIHQLRRNVAGVTAANDSGLVFADLVTATLLDADATEGSPAPGGGDFGQFTNRVALMEAYATFQSRRIQPGSTLPALFKRAAGIGTFTVANSGAPAIGVPGASFKNFLSEGAAFSNGAVFRATLTGDGITAKTNEGVWHEFEGLIARKGQQVPGEAAGVVWKRFLGLWPVTDTGLAIHAAISGPGVKPGTTGIWVRQEDGSFLRLLREGEPLEGPDGVKIRKIQRIDFDPAIGRYAILASTTGSAATNQVLLGGLLGTGDPQLTPSLRKPRLLLRKGQQLQASLGSIRTIKAISLAKTTDKTGMGAKGGGQAVNSNGYIGLQAILDQNQRALLSLETLDLLP